MCFVELLLRANESTLSSSSVLCYCDKTSDIISLKRGKVMGTHGFRGFCPLSLLFWVSGGLFTAWRFKFLSLGHLLGFPPPSKGTTLQNTDPLRTFRIQLQQLFSTKETNQKSIQHCKMNVSLCTLTWRLLDRKKSLSKYYQKA